MKRTLLAMIAVACLSVPAIAAPQCGVPLPAVEKIASGSNGPHKLNDAVAMAFLNKFNNTGEITSYEGPVWVVDRPQDNVIEVIATSQGQGCVFVAPGHLRDILLKMIYGDAA